MADRYNKIPKAYWKYLGVAFDAIDVDLAAIESGGGGGGTLATVLPGSTLRCPWNGTAWTYNGQALTARPSSRTDIYFDLSGAPVATADPSWMIDGDTRSDVA